MRVRILTFVLLLLSVSMAAAQADVIEFPAPTGPYQVGSTYRHWLDESRDELATDDPDDKRDVLVRMWYPADVPDGAEPMLLLPYAEAQLTAFDRQFPGMADQVDVIGAMHAHSYLDAPPAASETPFPIILFSHGFTVMPDFYTLQIEELASHGYVVVGTYHSFASATVYPDGRVLNYYADVTTVGAEDQRFVMERLAELNADDPEGVFSGRLNVDQFGVFGMSMGGDIADKICRADDRCAAYVNQEGPPVNTSQDRTQLPPAMFMSARENTLKRPFERWDGPAYGLRFKRFGHLHFTDLPLWAGDLMTIVALRIAGDVDSMRVVPTYVLAFFDTYLKGEPSPLLDGPSDDYPNVEFESKNVE